MSTGFSTELLFFAVYALGGWLLETIYAGVRQQHFVNRGFMFGCFCPIYGFGALLIIHVAEWTGARIEDPFVRMMALICVSALLVTWLEYFTGLILDKVFQRRWWDYSGNQWNIGGYVCVEYSLLWGLIAYLLTEFLHPAVTRMLALAPAGIITAAAWCVLVYFILDAAISISVEWFRCQSAARPALRHSNAEEYSACVEDLLPHEQVQRMDMFIQHGRTTCLKHSQAVSFLSYRICRKCKLDYRSAARGGLLHDLFLYDWHDPAAGGRWHGFTHPRVALRNAEDIFALNKIERDIIAKHMWPLTPAVPRFRESWVVCLADKIVTCHEFIEGVMGRHEHWNSGKKAL
ncbi:putative ABC transporter permease [Paenibacillus sp. 22594]|uniref:putative ABC transporter permease n=1 Tax=Paenibacillus sp. 22594 TaxID=3453947 RepID=UPI003F84AA4D